jgi:hypothetical protein
MKWQKVIYYSDNWFMVAGSCLSINGLYLWFDKQTVFLDVPESLKFSWYIFYTLRAVKWQIVWLVCKNQDTVAVQNV